MSSFLYKAKDITYSELKIKHLKNLQKSLVGDPDFDIVLLNIDNILAEITDLSLQEIQQLDLVEYFTLLCHIRTTCIGNIVYAELTQQKNIKLSINIDEIISQLAEINYKEILTDENIDNNISIKYRLPCPRELPSLLTNDIEIFCIPFIKSIAINNTVFDFSNFSFDEKVVTIKKLPAKITSDLYKKIYKVLEIYTKTNLLEHIKDVKEFIPFSFNSKSYVALISLLYGDQLLSIYDNIFLLCKFGNFTPSYIEECTPGEYYIFCRKLETFMAKKQEMQNQSPDLNEYGQGFSDGFTS